MEIRIYEFDLALKSIKALLNFDEDSARALGMEYLKVKTLRKNLLSRAESVEGRVSDIELLVEALNKRLPECASGEDVTRDPLRPLEKQRRLLNASTLLRKKLESGELSEVKRLVKKELGLEISGTSEKDVLAELEKIKFELARDSLERSSCVALKTVYRDGLRGAILVQSFGSIYAIVVNDVELVEKLAASEVHRIARIVVDEAIAAESGAINELTVRPKLLGYIYMLVSKLIVDGVSDLLMALFSFVPRAINTIDSFKAYYITSKILYVSSRMFHAINSLALERIRDLRVHKGTRFYSIGPFIYQAVSELAEEDERFRKYFGSLGEARDYVAQLVQILQGSLESLNNAQAAAARVVDKAKEEYKETKPLLFLSALSAIVLGADGLIQLYPRVLMEALEILGVFLGGMRTSLLVLSIAFDTIVEIEIDYNGMLASRYKRIAVKLGREYAEYVGKRSNPRMLFVLLSLLATALSMLAAAEFVISSGNPMARYALYLSGFLSFALAGYGATRYDTEYIYERGIVRVSRRIDKKPLAISAVFLALPAVIIVLRTYRGTTFFPWRSFVRSPARSARIPASRRASRGTRPSSDRSDSRSRSPPRGA